MAIEEQAKEMYGSISHLRSAVKEFGKCVENLFDEPIDLPRGYRVTYDGTVPYFESPELYDDDGYGPHRERFYPGEVGDVSIDAALQLVDNLKSGWLDELSQMIAERKSESDDAAKYLESTLSDLRNMRN